MKVEVIHGNVEQALRILKRKIAKEGLMRRLKEIEHYEKPCQKRIRKNAQNVKNVRKAESKTRLKPRSRRNYY